MHPLADEKYIRLTTFTKDGRAKPAPVWIADLSDGTLGFTTDLGSWKVKRIRNTPSVEITPSDARGNPIDGAATVSAIAEVRTGAAAGPVETAIKAKYGWQFTAISLLGKIRRDRTEVCGVVLTLEH